MYIYVCVCVWCRCEVAGVYSRVERKKKPRMACLDNAWRPSEEREGDAPGSPVLLSSYEHSVVDGSVILRDVSGDTYCLPQHLLDALIASHRLVSHLSPSSSSSSPLSSSSSPP